MRFGKDTDAECLPKVNLYDPRAESDRSIDTDRLGVVK